MLTESNTTFISSNINWPNHGCRCLTGLMVLRNLSGNFTCPVIPSKWVNVMICDLLRQLFHFMGHPTFCRLVPRIVVCLYLVEGRQFTLLCTSIEYLLPFNWWSFKTAVQYFAVQFGTFACSHDVRQQIYVVELPHVLGLFRLCLEFEKAQLEEFCLLLPYPLQSRQRVHDPIWRSFCSEMGFFVCMCGGEVTQ